jgi:4-hydroxy-tetrahydrodipicolinate reductase
MVGKVCLPSERELVEVCIKGVPELHLVSDKVPIGLATCTEMVNRIPDVINAEPGFVTIEKLPRLKYRAYPLHFYLTK